MGEEGGNGQNVLGGIGKKFGQVNMKDPLTMTFFVCKAFEIVRNRLFLYEIFSSFFLFFFQSLQAVQKILIAAFISVCDL